MIKPIKAIQYLLILGFSANAWGLDNTIERLISDSVEATEKLPEVRVKETVEDTGTVSYWQKNHHVQSLII